jgi:hypothetical protein
MYYELKITDHKSFISNSITVEVEDSENNTCVADAIRAAMLEEDILAPYINILAQDYYGDRANYKVFYGAATGHIEGVPDPFLFAFTMIEMGAL